jgi:hypothetical protein
LPASWRTPSWVKLRSLAARAAGLVCPQNRTPARLNPAAPSRTCFPA